MTTPELVRSIQEERRCQVEFERRQGKIDSLVSLIVGFLVGGIFVLFLTTSFS